MKRRTVPLVAALAMLALLTAAPATSQTAVCSVTNQRTGTNYTSLSSAVSAANAGDTLLIQNTCGGNIEINKSLTLQGQRPAGAPAATIAAVAGGSSVLTVGNLANVANLRIANLRITGGHGATSPMAGFDGGGMTIFSGSTVTLASGARVVNNRASSGGGITTEGTLVMNGSSRISGNRIRFAGAGVSIGCVTRLPDGSCSGGGTVVMNDHAAIVDNIAGLGGGASVGSGGGVSTYLGTLRMRENSTIARNTATTLLGQGFGGGVYNSGFVFLNGNSTITENAVGENADPPRGGGVYNFQVPGNPGGQLTLNGGRVFNNTPNDICTQIDLQLTCV
jgi:hypothetical protein